MSIAEPAATLQPTPRRRAGDERERRLRGVRPLVIDSGCDVRLRRRGLTELGRVALLEWLPVARSELVLLEGSRMSETPAACVASLIRPPTVWPLREAVQAARLLGRERPLERVPFAWLVAHARGRVDGAHLTRGRARAARIARQLPFEELPSASATAGAVCALVAYDDDVCASIAALALARYSLSEIVAREAAALHLP